MKKAIAFIIAIFCIGSAFIFTAGAASEEYYIFSSIYTSDRWGTDPKIIGQTIVDIQDNEFKNPAEYPNYKYAKFHYRDTAAQQGVNGFYYMYGTDFNKGGSFDVNTLKECVWANNTKEGATTYSVYNDKDYFWNPVPTPSVKYVDINADPYLNNYWWIISEEGRINPWGDFTAAVKWVVPADGNYKVEAKVKHGYSVPDPTWIEDILAKSDGNHIMIYKNSEKLYSNTAAKGVKAADNVKNFSKDLAELKKGDALYFIADQGIEPYYDETQWKIKVTRYIEDGAPEPTETPASALLASSVPSDTDGAPAGLIIGIIAAVVVIGGGAAYYFLVIKRKLIK